jgi:hypothetical protein
LPEACESAHMGPPDFRVRGKIFAMLGYPDADWVMVKLTTQQQKQAVGADPSIFIPVKGGWGRKGATNVHPPSGDPAAVQSALQSAWRNAAPRKLAAEYDANE